MSQFEAKKLLYEFNRNGTYLSPGEMDEVIQVLGKRETEKIERSALYERNRAKWEKEK